MAFHFLDKDMMRKIINTYNDYTTTTGPQLEYAKKKHVLKLERIHGITTKMVPASNTLVAWSITIVSHVKKSYGRLARLMVLWTRSARISGVVGTCAYRRRFESSSCR